MSTDVQTTAPAPAQNDEFLSLLVQAVTGIDPKELPEDKRLEIENKVVAIFSDYIVAFVGEKYGEKDAMRLKAARQTGEDVFTKFTDLGPKFDEAYQSFLDNLEKIWQERMKQDENANSGPSTTQDHENKAE
jgi:hypothetical protein